MHAAVSNKAKKTTIKTKLNIKIKFYKKKFEIETNIYFFCESLALTKHYGKICVKTNR